MMGAGIAYVCARAGIEVVLKDVSIEAAERGKAYSAKLLDKPVERGRLTAAGADAVLARITPTADAADLAGCDLVIEAVFESQELKHAGVRARSRTSSRRTRCSCSNTSTLPITGLADGVDAAGRLHRPALLLAGRQDAAGRDHRRRADRRTQALARAYDVVRADQKTPIVVNDSRGLLHLAGVRHVGASKASAMLAEGIDPATIEQAATQAGLPGAAAGDDRRGHADAAAEDPRRGGQGGRGGRRRRVRRAPGDGGDRPDGRRVRPPRARLPARGSTTTRPTGSETACGRACGSTSRMATARSSADRSRPAGADHRSRCRWSRSSASTRACCAPSPTPTSARSSASASRRWTGGALQYVNGYGLKAFVERSHALAASYGRRFEPPAFCCARRRPARSSADHGAVSTQANSTESNK